MSNHEILGVSSNASREEIKKAFRKLSLVYHPDRPGGNNEKFIVIKQAYEELTSINPTKVHQRADDFFVSRAYVHHTVINKEGDCDISVTFRHILWIETKGIPNRNYNWVTVGMIGAGLLIKKEDLIRCNYKFILRFEPITGRGIAYGIELPDPRGRYRKFIDNIKTLLTW